MIDNGCNLHLVGREKDCFNSNGVKHPCVFFEHDIKEAGIDGIMTSFVYVCSMRLPESDTKTYAVFYQHCLPVEDELLIQYLLKIPVPSPLVTASHTSSCPRTDHLTPASNASTSPAYSHLQHIHLRLPLCHCSTIHYCICTGLHGPNITEVESLHQRLANTENSWARSREDSDQLRPLMTGTLSELLDIHRDLKSDEHRVSPSTPCTASPLFSLPTSTGILPPSLHNSQTAHTFVPAVGLQLHQLALSPVRTGPKCVPVLR